MGKLEKLEEELYGKEGDEKFLKRVRRRLSLPGTLQKPETSWIGQKPVEPIRKKIFSGLPFFKIFLAVLFTVLLVGGSVFLFLYLGTRGREAELTIHGRDEIESGESTIFTIAFRNVSKTALKEAELTVILPEGSLLTEGGVERPAPPRFIKKVKDLEPGEEGLVEISARLFGREKEEKEVQAILLYRPENLRARFSSRISRKFVITSVPLALSWEVPGLVASGQELEVKIRYTSTASRSFDNLSLRVEYPSGFTFSSASPKPDFGNEIWKIGKLDPGSEGSLVLRGKVVGEGGEFKTFKGGLGIFDELTREWRVYSESTQELKIAVSPLAIQAFLDDTSEKVISPGDKLTFSLKYRNNTAYTIKNVSINAFLEGSILLLNTANIDKGGVFNFNTRSVVWDPATTPELRELEPDEEGTLTFSLDTRDRPAVRSSQDRNLVVKLKARIEAATIPLELVGTNLVAEDPLEFKVNSKIIFSGRALYRLSPIPNSGPLPPRVGEKTSYTIIWEIRNFTNDLEAAEVFTSLPPNVNWENVISPQDSKISFDTASRQVRWRIGSVKSGTGVITPALSSAFKVSITPSEVDLGKAVNLTTESRLEGTDTFTSVKVSSEIEPLSTELRDDPSSATKEWEVVR